MSLFLIPQVAFSNISSKSAGVELIGQDSFEAKLLYYRTSSLTLDEVEGLLHRTVDERERLELLLFYLKRQFKFDISIGLDRAREALYLARKFGLKLHESIALSNVATSSCLYRASEEAHLYADSALWISRDIGEGSLESSIYYTKYLIDFVNDDHVAGVENLLKCIDLAEKHGSKYQRNERRLRLVRLAIRRKHTVLAQTQLNKLKSEDLELDNQVMYLIYQGQWHSMQGQQDSAKKFFEKAVALRFDFETSFELGKWYNRNDLTDSAIYFLEEGIALMDPRQSYIAERYMELADLYDRTGDKKLSEVYLKKRIEESKRLVEKNTEALNYSELADFYVRHNQLDSAYKYARKSYDMANKYDFGTSILASTRILAYLTEVQGQFEQSNAFLKEYLKQTELKNALLVTEQLKKAEMDSKIDYWIEVGAEKVKRAEQLRNLIIVITGLLLLLFLAILFMFLGKRKALTIQESLNAKVLEQNAKITQQGAALKEANTSLSESNDLLEKKVTERTRELKEANEKLTNYSARLEEYANITAHNLRGPLVNIIGLANVYDSHNSHNPKNDRLINMINKSAEEIDDVVQELNDLLDLEREEQNKKEKISVAHLITDLETWIKEKARHAEVSFTGTTSLDEVYSVRPYLERTLRELLINSYHYRDLERGLDINLTVEERAGGMQIKVEDNGLGIDLNRHGTQIFNLNQRFHERNGRGVGLYLVKRQVEAMDGSVSVESVLGEGACFTILLPQGNLAV
ncbi:MAG: HAMP domain-containing sensor histidine kinase [Reichenbachiella sp.]|uniref:HAMP domain-containing sensor histidine kinase n=1 Tax=Reichenbachiella sp. TaxID=2184521 RepID=UPI0032630183